MVFIGVIMKNYSYLLWGIFVLLMMPVVIIEFVYYFCPRPPEYITSTVRRGNIEKNILSTGKIQAIESISVGAQVSGQVKSLNVKLGDHVIKGQQIAEIDDILQRNELKNADAALNIAKADLQAKQVQLQQAEKRLRRQKEMLQEDASSREDFETAETTLSTTYAELLALKAKLVQAQIEVDNKNVNLSYTRVLAPIDGIVIAVVTPQGQMVNPSQNTPTIVKLARLDMMTIKARISEADITRISIGQKAYFTIFSEPGRRYDATLRTVELAPESVMKDNGCSINQHASVYYNALLDVSNPENKLRIAMTARVTLLIDEAKDTLLIPFQAVHKTEDNKLQVHVLGDDSKLEIRAIKTGLSNGIDVQIIEGLKLGEKVVQSEHTQTSPEEGFFL